MERYWFKNRFLLTVLFSLLVSGIIGGLLLRDRLISESQNRQKTSVYNLSDMDYDIPSPSVNQLEEIEKLDFIDAAFGYYFTNGTLLLNGCSISTPIMFSDDTDDMNITMFNDNRLIQKSDISYENPIYVDYAFAKKNNVSLDDAVVYGDITFNVAALYENNSYNEAVLAFLPDELKAEFEDKAQGYSGAFIAVNDSNASEAYFRNYKPEGRLKPRNLFDNDEQYEIHRSSWENANYYNEITSFGERENSISLRNVVSSWIVCLAHIVLSLVVSVCLYLRKSERVYFGKKKSHIGLVKYYVFASAIEVTISILVYTGIVMMTKLISSSYISLSSIVKTEVFVTLICIASGVINFGISFALVSIFSKPTKQD